MNDPVKTEEHEMDVAILEPYLLLYTCKVCDRELEITLPIAGVTDESSMAVKKPGDEWVIHYGGTRAAKGIRVAGTEVITDNDK